MWELLKEYLENNEVYSYKCVDVVDFTRDGFRCNVRFRHEDAEHEKSLSLNLWDITVYINNKEI